MKIAFFPIASGAIFGIIAPLLVYFGNPKNMGVCAACFTRDIAGALGLQNAIAYMRPEIITLVLGSFVSAFVCRQFHSRGGSSPLARFLLGFFAMIGALVFLGCPWRMLLRISAGDLNAIVGLIGFVVGVGVGLVFVKRGFSLGASKPLHLSTGLLFPVIMLVCLVLLVVSVDSQSPLRFSDKGPGSMHASILISLAGGLIIGALFQKSKLCSISAISNVVFLRDSSILQGIIALVVFAFITNFALGFVNVGFENQPIAHSDGIWNFLAMALSGLCLVLAGGCPGRQLILSGEGDSDAGIFIFGALFGAALAHNFALASSPAGIGQNAPIVVIAGFIFAIVLGLFAKAK